MTTELEQDEAARRLLGTWVRDKYRLDRILGSGGMAVVFAATHRNKKRVAVKILRGTFATHSDMQRRFLREGYVANTVDHPGAVSVLDDDLAEDGTAFLVMELLDGAPVDALVGSSDETLSIAAVMNIAFQLLDTLSAAHAKEVIHRDIKPGNLFVTRSGQLKVLDFGIARLRDADPSRAAQVTTQAGAAFGTPAFMGPEQALGKVNEIDGRSDLWSVGATMFSLIAGREVHLADTVQHAMVLAATQPAVSLAVVRPSVPASVVAIVDRALAFDKSARWPSAAAMRDAIAAAYGDVSTTPMRPDDLVDLLPPPATQPDLSGASFAPPPRDLVAERRGRGGAAQSPKATLASDAHAATVAAPHTGDRTQTAAPLSSDPRGSTSRSGRRSVGLAIAAVIFVVGAVGMSVLRRPDDAVVGAGGTSPRRAEPVMAATSGGEAPRAVQAPIPSAAPAPSTPSSSSAQAPRGSEAPAAPRPAKPTSAPATPATSPGKPATPRPASRGPTDFDTQ